jgi:hypothetical protein
VLYAKHIAKQKIGIDATIWAQSNHVVGRASPTPAFRPAPVYLRTRGPLPRCEETLNGAGPTPHIRAVLLIT